MPSPSHAGAVLPPAGMNALDYLTHNVLDDIVFNVVHDLVLKVHRDEKVARAATAAMVVETVASNATTNGSGQRRADIRVETDAAIYEDGRVVLKGNPLQTTHDVRCRHCRLTRMTTHGIEGDRMRDGGIRGEGNGSDYCKLQPYIDEPHLDIYGQTWVAHGPGRGKRKKEKEKEQEQEQDKSSTPELSDYSTRAAHMLSFPSATCSKCKRCILVTRLNNHMGMCIGNTGRNASRTAAKKIVGRLHHKDGNQVVAADPEGEVHDSIAVLRDEDFLHSSARGSSTGLTSDGTEIMEAGDTIVVLTTPTSAPLPLPLPAHLKSNGRATAKGRSSSAGPSRSSSPNTKRRGSELAEADTGKAKRQRITPIPPPQPQQTNILKSRMAAAKKKSPLKREVMTSSSKAGSSKSVDSDEGATRDTIMVSQLAKDKEKTNMGPVKRRLGRPPKRHKEG